MSFAAERAGRRAAAVGGLLALLAAGACLLGPARPAEAATASNQDRYSLVHGCFGLRSLATGNYVTKAGNGYTATAGGLGGAEPFRMQATDLGSYLLYGAAADFLAVDPTPVLGGVVSADEASGNADWTVIQDGDAFRLVNQAQRLALSVNGSGDVVAVENAGNAGRFAFDERGGCATYPEVDVNVSGAPSRGSPLFGETSGFLEGHLHHMAFEFLGGRAHCGRPWHRFGAPFALRDCPDHEVGDGCAAVLENVLFGNPARCHDPVGWPTFNDWPHPQSLTHEQTYYKWIERAWRSGLRIFVVLFVENRVLCEVYPLKQNSCNEMESVLLQERRLQQFQDYVDAQSGGPGEGWFRIVRNPFQARKQINKGNLAVVQGMEVSEPFGCKLNQPAGAARVPECDRADIDSWLDRLHELGVRQLEIVNKFDNALTGVAGDNGTTGTIVNSGNAAPPPLGTGSFWDLGSCPDPENHDHAPTGVEVPHNDDMIIANGLAALSGPLPVYPEPPLCNRLGLSDLGEHAVRGIVQKRMIFDPDHMSVFGRDRAMEIVEEEAYSGVISSHSWSTPSTLPRIYSLGGVITPYAGDSESFIHQGTHLQDVKDELGRQYYGIGYGADMNGFGSQGDPRGAGVSNPVTYPFQSFDGTQTIEKNTSGQRTWDINADGVAHYGMYPDWIEDLRQIAGDRIVEDLGRGAEAYLQMWERARGIRPVRCGGWRGRDFHPNGLGDRVRMNSNPKAALRRAGQPEDRTGTWTWCASGSHESKRVKAVYRGTGNIGLILSTLPQHAIAGAAPGDGVNELPRAASRIGPGIWSLRADEGRRYVYVGDRGRIVATGLAHRAIANRGPAITRFVDRAALP